VASLVALEVVSSQRTFAATLKNRWVMRGLVLPEEGVEVPGSVHT